MDDYTPKRGRPRTRPEGWNTNSAAAITDRFERLRAANPEDLRLKLSAGAVTNGDWTANRVAELVGWRKKRILISSPISVASRLALYMPLDELRVLVRMLDQIISGQERVLREKAEREEGRDETGNRKRHRK